MSMFMSIFMVIKTAIALAAGYIVSYFFPSKLQMIERAVIAIGTGIAILILINFFFLSYNGILEVRENLISILVIVIIAFGLQIYLKYISNRW
ncbi:MAG: hypothetical protein QXJ68_03025 [Methanocellales archaeon]